MANEENYQRFLHCFHDWVAKQRLDLEEMQQALTHCPGDAENLSLLTDKVTKHFKEYVDSRAALARHDATAFFSPSWCTTFENSFLWIGGCRPSLSIRLVYSLCGSDLEGHLTEFLEGVRTGNLGEITGRQLKSIDALQATTIKEEDKLSSWLARLQEAIADEPLVKLANSSVETEESIKGVDEALDAHSLDLSSILIAADELRMATIEELMEILTPLQAVELLVASMKLHLSMHEWSKRRDQKMGIPRGHNIPSATSGHGSSSLK